MVGNNALTTNQGIQGTADTRITSHGSDWYFTVCAVMGVSTLVFLGLSFTKPRTERLFHYITATITLVAAIAYFSMGSGLGQTPINVEFFHHGTGTREIFWARYVDWFITTPLLLLDLLLTAGMPWPTIMITILMDEVMVVTGLIGALVPTSFKWGFYVFGCVAFFFVFYQLAFVGRAHARALGPNPSRTFNMCGVLTLVIWCLYPIAWGVSEGGNVISADSEAAFYGVLDLIAKPVFGFLLIFGHRNITASELGLAIHDIGDIHNRTNGAHPYAGEKNTGTTANNGVTEPAGTTTTAV